MNRNFGAIGQQEGCCQSDSVTRPNDTSRHYATAEAERYSVDTAGPDPWIHRSDNMKCKSCMWFVPKAVSPERRQELCSVGMGSPLYDMGRCRRHAPSMGGYPVVMVNDWCGDHRLDENKFRAY